MILPFFTHPGANLIHPIWPTFSIFYPEATNIQDIAHIFGTIRWLKAVASWVQGVTNHQANVPNRL